MSIFARSELAAQFCKQDCSAAPIFDPKRFKLIRESSEADVDA